MVYKPNQGHQEPTEPRTNRTNRTDGATESWKIAEMLRGGSKSADYLSSINAFDRQCDPPILLILAQDVKNLIFFGDNR